MSSNRLCVLRFLPINALCIAGLLGGPTFAQEGKNDGRSEIAVPEQHASQGEVYYVVPNKKPKVTFKSKTSVETFKGTNALLTGYVVSPNDEETLPIEFKAGEFRLPVAAFDTANSSRDGHLRGERWLHTKSFPEIVFTLTEVRDAELVKERKTSTTYDATLVGKMVVVGQEKEISVDARIILKPESKKTKRVAPGDLMTINSKFDIILSDFGIGIGDQAIETKRVAATMKIDVRITLTNQKPE